MWGFFVYFVADKYSYRDSDKLVEVLFTSKWIGFIKNEITPVNVVENLKPVKSHTIKFKSPKIFILKFERYSLFKNSGKISDKLYTGKLLGCHAS